MLTEMDDKCYVSLSSLIQLKCAEKDEMIFTKGAPSEFSYIVMRGRIRVS
jgi:CRP-like cAMP-binding protein